jgi:ATP-binding cassette subfamily B protein
VRDAATLLAAGWRASRVRMLAAGVLLLLGYVSQPLAPLALKHVTDAVVARDARTATFAAALLPLVTLVNTTASRIAHVLWVELADLHAIRMTQTLGELTHGTDGIEHLERADYADRLELIRNEGNSMYRGIESAMHMLSLTAQFAITLVLLAQVQPLLLLLFVLGIPPLLAGRWAFARADAVRVAAAGRARLATHLLDLAVRQDAAKEIRVFGLQDELRGRLRELRRDLRRRLVRARLEGLAAAAAGQLFFAAGYVAGLLLVVRGAVAGRQTPGDVVLAITLAAQTNTLVVTAAALSRWLQRSAAAMGRIAWLRRLVAGRRPRVSGEAAAPEELREGIRFEGVGFRYPGTDAAVLGGVELELRAGSTVAFVGENGAGKSTLVKLLSRFYEPTEGRITVDGVDLAQIPVEAWRARVTAGFQDFVRFELLVRESVGIGDLAALDDLDAVAAALERADARALVDGLPAGLETALGKSHSDGAELSGGQWQKVALARAMMRERPLLLVLDEPTSALDAHAEHVLFERYAASARAVARATGGIAVFVSHRFSTVRMADHIVVVDGGAVVEQGSHDELAARGGIYAELYALQAAAYAG